MKTDLINGKPLKSIILFALPIMASSMLQYNYNLVDNIIVGRFVGTNALAALVLRFLLLKPLELNALIK